MINAKSGIHENSKVELERTEKNVGGFRRFNWIVQVEVHHPYKILIGDGEYLLDALIDLAGQMTVERDIRLAAKDT